MRKPYRPPPVPEGPVQWYMMHATKLQDRRPPCSSGQHCKNTGTACTHARRETISSPSPAPGGSVQSCATLVPMCRTWTPFCCCGDRPELRWVSSQTWPATWERWRPGRSPCPRSLDTWRTIGLPGKQPDAGPAASSASDLGLQCRTCTAYDTRMQRQAALVSYIDAVHEFIL